MLLSSITGYHEWSSVGGKCLVSIRVWNNSFSFLKLQLKPQIGRLARLSLMQRVQREGSETPVILIMFGSVQAHDLNLEHLQVC